MGKYVAFLRAINVAGHATLKMNDLQHTFVSAGCRQVTTYIQSGNVIFESPAGDAAAIVQRVRSRLGKVLGGDPDIILRTIREIESLVRREPFRAFDAEPDVKRYVSFLSRKPRRKPRFPLVSSTEALRAIAMTNREVFIVSRRKKNGFFGFPNNFIEEELDVLATTRNWSTVTKVVDFAGSWPAVNHTGAGGG